MSKMTLKEVAEALNVNHSTVSRHAKRMYPELCKNGVIVYLDEEQVTRIKQEIQNSGRKDLDNLCNVAKVTTDLEMMEQSVSVLAWMMSKVQTLQAENDQLRPIADAHRTLTDSEGAITIAELSKVLEVGEYKLFRALRDAKILQPSGPSKNLPY